MIRFFWQPSPEDHRRHVIAGHRCTLHGKQVRALCGQSVTIPDGPPNADDNVGSALLSVLVTFFAGVATQFGLWEPTG